MYFIECWRDWIKLNNKHFQLSFVAETDCINNMEIQLKKSFHVWIIIFIIR